MLWADCNLYKYKVMKITIISLAVIVSALLFCVSCTDTSTCSFWAVVEMTDSATMCEVIYIDNFSSLKVTDRESFTCNVNGYHEIISTKIVTGGVAKRPEVAEIQLKRTDGDGVCNLYLFNMNGNDFIGSPFLFEENGCETLRFPDALLSENEMTWVKNNYDYILSLQPDQNEVTGLVDMKY